MRLDGGNAVGDHAHQQIDVVAPPITDVGESSRIGGKRGRIFIRDDRIVRVEVVVGVDAIHIITPDHVRHNRGNEVTYSLKPRVEDLQLRAVADVECQDPVGMLDNDMVGGKRVVPDFPFRTVRVEPGVQFHSALVGLASGKLQRVIERTRRPTLLSC
jgi:hypothetical protein